MYDWIFVEQCTRDSLEVMMVPTQDELFGTSEVDWGARLKMLLKIVTWII